MSKNMKNASLLPIGSGEEKTRFFEKPGVRSVAASLVCIAAGILVGFLVMLIIAAGSQGCDPLMGLATLIGGPFSSGSWNYITTNLGDMIFYAAPLILTGLSVAIAFKTGLFNIGAPGQFLMGTAGSLTVALSIDSTGKSGGFWVWLLAIAVGMICGMLWGAIPGLFKAFFGVNEVIVCIMTNWIAANLVSWFFSTKNAIINTGKGKSGYLITTASTGNGTPKLALDKVFKGSYVDAGILIAVICAAAIYVILNKTTFGYELKACGSNRNAAKYAGMNEKRNIVLSMAIAGLLAALGGAIYYLNPGIEFSYKSAYSNLPDYGFNGIPAALLASNNPIGVIFSGLFLRYLSQGGDNLTSAGYNRYIADIIIAIIIYFSGSAKLIRDFLSEKIKERAGRKKKSDGNTASANGADTDNDKKEA